MIILKEETFSGIPALHIVQSAKENEPLPTVLFWHGFTSGMEHNLHIAYQLVKRNIRVILPEAHHHGSRSQRLSEKELTFQFWPIVLQSVAETEDIYRSLEERHLLQNSRIFLAGTSMGGIITCGTLVKYPWVKGAAVLMGNPAWETFARRQITLLEQQGALPLSEEERENQVKQLIPFDLSQHIEAVNHRPLFFWHGRQDDVVPYIDSFSFYQQLKARTRLNDDETLVYHLDQEASHKVTRKAMLLMADWIAKHI
ncbi:serine aminopeptidase domain-containing protein [Aliibacillus thermotolerans]|uniref:Serine aminopeptidase domain-containing protein n=1 Tax=Aliibacillus thermotolerans TaxID=1834418 RepID=A0ABW0U6G3_9BACI|nr:alpha/beta hydrolase [Aliibacillus thermotolerans]MDA3129187.1 prolyl oligopeptidase family serine peptidase [Aliibacillus thermotolerans]